MFIEKFLHKMPSKRIYLVKIWVRFGCTLVIDPMIVPGIIFVGCGNFLMNEYKPSPRKRAAGQYYPPL